MNSEKLAKLQQSVRIGGKGTPRRKVKRTSKTEGSDKNLQATLQKLNAQPIQGMDTVNLFFDDGKVMQYPKPQVQAAVNANTFAIHGRSVEKSMAEMLPEVLSSMGPESMEQLKRLTEQLQASGQLPNASAGAKEAEDDEIPELVDGENFEDRVD